MVTLTGNDAREAAELILEFLQQSALKVQDSHPRFLGLFRKYSFRAGYTNFEQFRGLDVREPVNMNSAFMIQARGLGMRSYIKNLPFPQSMQRYTDWVDCADFKFNRVDWDDTPGMQAVVCNLTIGELIPMFFRDELKDFLRVNFGNVRISYFDSAQIPVLV